MANEYTAIIKRRRDTAANWASENPVIPDGQRIYYEDLDQWKTGNGTDHAEDLDFEGGGTVTVASNRLLGRVSSGTGAAEAIELGTGLSFDGNVLNAELGEIDTGEYLAPNPTQLDAHIASAAAAPSSTFNVTLTAEVNVTDDKVVPSNLLMRGVNEGKLVNNGGTVTFEGIGLLDPLSSTPIFEGFEAANQVETSTVVAASGITSSGNARSIVTAAGMPNSPKTVTVALTTGAHTTAALIATAFRTALAADADVKVFFDVGGSGADITLTAKAPAANDATMNFTIEDVTSAGITEDLTSTNTVAGARDIYWKGIQQVETNTVVAASGITTSGNARSVVTMRGLVGGSKTITVALTTGAHTTAALIATAFRAALSADMDIAALVTVGGTGANITLTKRNGGDHDPSMNFTIEDVTSVGITEDTSSTNTTAGGGEWPKAVSTQLWDGATLTERARCADAALAGKSAQIICYPGELTGGTSQATNLNITQGHHLQLMPGEYTNVFNYDSTPPLSAPIVMQSNTSIRGMPGTRVYESSVTGFFNGPIIIDASYGANHALTSENITIDGIHFVGNPALQNNSGVGTILLGNCKGAKINNNIFEEITGYITLGGGGGTAGEYAENIECFNNQFLRCGTQACAVINAKNVRIVGNYFDQKDTIYAGSYSILDVEPNGETEVAEDILIADNVFDMRDTLNFAHAIAAQAIHGGKNITIRNNTIYAGSIVDPDPSFPFGQMQPGIYVLGFHEGYIHGNTVRGGYYAQIHTHLCRDIQVYDNDTFYGQATAGGTIRVTGCSNCDISNNRLHKTTYPDSSIWQEGKIVEGEWPHTATSSGNTLTQVVSGSYDGFPFQRHLIGHDVLFNNTVYTIDSYAYATRSQWVLDGSPGTVPQSTFLSASGVDTTTNEITTQAAHGLIDGAKIYISWGTVMPPHTLPTADPVHPSLRFYYAIVTAADKLKLAASLADVVSETAIDITATGTGTHTISAVVDTLFSSNTYSGNKTPDGIYLSETGTSIITSSANDNKVIEQSGPYVLTRDDGIVVFTASDVTATPPDPRRLNGKIFTIKKASVSGTLSVTPAFGSIDGQGTVEITDAYGWVTIQAHSTGYRILNRSLSPGGTVAGASIGTVFTLFEDATTAGTSEETLYTGTIPAGRLSSLGDVIDFEFSGTLGSNTNDKDLLLSFAGTTLFDSTTLTGNGEDFKIEGSIMRISNSAVRTTVNLITPEVGNQTNVASVTGLNLTTTDYDLLLKATTSEGAGDITAKTGRGVYIPGEPVAGINEIEGLWAAFESDSYSGSDGSNITTNWPDITGNGNTAVVNGTPTFETNELNGKPIVRMSADSSDWYLLPDMSSFTAGAMVTVRKVRDVTTSGGDAFGVGSGLASHLPFASDTSNIYDDFGSSERRIFASGITILNTWHITYQYSAANDWGYEQNWVELEHDATNTVSFYWFPFLSKNITGELLKEDVAARYIFNVKPSASALAKLRRRIQDKYGLG